MPRPLPVVAAAYALPLFLAGITRLAARELHPIAVAVAADVAATVVIFAFSYALANSSLYGPYWSVAPIPIAAWWAAGAPGGPGLRASLVLLLVTAWGVRLTANWVARWHGLADEDFRYVEIRARTGRLYWPASLVSIHLMPTDWVFLGLLPTCPALSSAWRFEPGSAPPGPDRVRTACALRGPSGYTAVRDTATTQRGSCA